jgi:choline dehydrogenase-like flavoprotein
MAYDLAWSPHMEAMRGKQIAPPHDVTDDKINDWIQSTALTAHHPSCTCPMGQDSASVVGPELRVRGIDRLRIVDA